MSYDSTVDAKKHIKEIQKVINYLMVKELEKRAKEHDQSKLHNPEKACYDKYIPLLRTAKYGSKEYEEIRDKMFNEGLKHHYEANRHHPEHFKNGINGMTLIDVVEMFCDWYAASKNSDTGFEAGLKMNKNKFKMSDQLYQIFKNTYDVYLK